MDISKPNYSLLNMSSEGLPVVLIVNSSVVNLITKQKISFHLSIIISLSEPAENGMPVSSESRIVTELTRQLEQELRSNENTVLLACRTWNGEKWLIFRIREPKKAEVT